MTLDPLLILAATLALAWGLSRIAAALASGLAL